VRNQHQLISEFSTKLDQTLKHYPAQTKVGGIAVAYSGGLDSSVLLGLSQTYCQERKLSLFAFHVNHGLSAHAHEWQEHCAQRAQSLGVEFDSARVVIAADTKDGIEASARAQRYRALGGLCVQRGVFILLTAHHQDDQAETLLLQLLRGSGVAGLAGMEPSGIMPKLLGTDKIVLVRPLLDVTRAELVTYTQIHALAHVDDESNSDTRFLRNAVRHKVMPALDMVSPGFVSRFARSVRHAQSAQRLLLELAREDWQRCGSREGLVLTATQELSGDRIDNLFRYWLSLNEIRMPTASRLQEMRKQLFHAKDDARITVIHDGVHIHRYRNSVYLDRSSSASDSGHASRDFFWNGEASLHFPEFGGVLHFDFASAGIAVDELKRLKLSLRLRQGGERIKLAANRSTRDMKHHYQYLRIPYWLRPRLPFVWTDKQIVFAAAVGMNYLFSSQTTDTLRVCLRWEFDDSQISSHN
jgi:tRNA(Ile)-lysidine synthase